MRVVIFLGSIAAILICVLATAMLWTMRLRDIEEAKRELRTLDTLLVEETERVMDSVDLILKSMQQRIAADGINSPQSFAAAYAGPNTNELLRAKIAGVPQIEALTLVAANGQVLALSRPVSAPEVNLSDRDYFKILENSAADVPVLPRRVLSRVSGREALVLARRISAPSGEFLGLVMATIDLGYFIEHYKAIRPDDGVVVTLWHRDGSALARFPPFAPDEPHKVPALADAPLRGEPFAYIAAPSSTAPRRVVAMMAAAQFPLAITISKSFDQILADWRRKSVLTLYAGSLAIGAIAFGVWLLGRQFETYEALRQAIAERSKAVAEREEAEAQLRQAQKLEAIGQLTGGIAHDFNNLLTAILGTLELLQRNSDTMDPRVQRWTTNAMEAAKRGAVLTSRLLAFSRRQPLDPEAADVAQRLGSMSDLLARTLGDGIEVVTIVEPGLWRPFVDPSGLDNAILNIALNARDAMDGRGRLVIEARNHVLNSRQEALPGVEDGEYVQIALSDTGRGISKDVIDRVFEPFFTTKPAGQGTGLGLSQVYGFVKQSGGHIALTSEIGVGTTVSMYLPRAAVEHDEERPPEDAGQDEDAPTGLGRGKILVVENDETVRSYAAETLRDLGFGVLEVPDASAALFALRSHGDIFLLVTDVGLPGMNGRELAEESLRLRPDLNVIFITGYARDTFYSRGDVPLPSNITLITKPFTRAELVQKLRLILLRQAASDVEPAPLRPKNAML
jgi:signal transduction histidine kinase